MSDKKSPVLAVPEQTAPVTAVIVAYKGFDANFQCRSYQYEVGKTYQHGGNVKACISGFHSCENPLDVFSYYEPGASIFAQVEASGFISRHDDDSKVASATIKIVAKISMPDLIARAVYWIKSKIDSSLVQHLMPGNSSAATNTGNRSAATNTGNSSAATNTGNSSAATNTGDSSAATNTGYSSAATNTGDSSAATNTGDSSAATNTGDSSAATNTGYRSAATNTGNSSAATNTGNRSAATNTGDSSAATVEGKQSVAIATGYASKASAAEGSAIVVCYRNDELELVHIKAAISGRDGIKPNTFYSLDANGDFVEVI